jgi:hypothetical protein
VVSNLTTPKPKDPVKRGRPGAGWNTLAQRRYFTDTAGKQETDR